ncbi:hypothetical protein PAAG_01221 [Paracoccidioides lutzii Pb01]|uniref:Uncharacterized protein n=1 Tax=Paracoccidioides lutzii (strain ATCC MYA-826 / Pb01) TaxID=502779 RepID=C1GRS6_PARBA|nr:hypothetical protein PAAG_01221 [Paracoccidioides lutzii Pb01]EEH38300.2 hypothetical protein PAAG_01221 [Paracoccidioides lutzii Pb01]
MSYDLTNRRDGMTAHHSTVKASLKFGPKSLGHQTTSWKVAQRNNTAGWAVGPNMNVVAKLIWTSDVPDLIQRKIRKIKKQNKRQNNQKKKGWLQKVGPRVWHRVSKKMPLMETIKRKRHESLTARGPFQPILLPSDIEGIQAVTMPSTPEPPEEAYAYSDISGEISDSSSEREDMFHLDVLDLLEDLAAIDVGTAASLGIWILTLGCPCSCKIPNPFTPHTTLNHG